MRVKCSIWDIDGTLLDIHHRVHLILGEKPDYMAFRAASDKDVAFGPAAITYLGLLQFIKPILVTARPVAEYDETAAQINRMVGPFDRLLMREPRHGNCDSVALKLQWLQQLRESMNYDPIIAFDDHPGVVKMYRENGVYTFGADDRNWHAGKWHENWKP